MSRSNCMKIVADDNIPGIHEWCASLGTIELVAGRTLQRAQLRAADVLLVRSVTAVNAALLEGTPVRFVGTATSGIDHIDVEYLARRGIQFAAAPGCNAVAVAEYVLACCLAYAAERRLPVTELTVGVIGHGHAGTAVVRLLSLLGVRCLINDPPRAATAPARSYLPLAAVLRADIVTLHVPLTATGLHPTRNLFGDEQFAAMAPHALVINAARGGVLVEGAWFRHQDQQRRLALDCWIGEPQIDLALCDRCWVASPHIAGHTVDARWRATEMLARQLASFVGLSLAKGGGALPAVPPLVLAKDAADHPLPALVFAAVDPRTYTTAMRAQPTADANGARQYFDQLRRRLGARREFTAYTVTGATMARSQSDLVAALGFNLPA
jgi:erythronate-4-phosphate dehydrogenase